MKSTPLVSIGVPVYNGEAYLGECLESILRQRYDNWECVVVNNQSTDNTLSIANSYAEKDQRFKVVTNKAFVDMMTNFNNAYKYANKDAKYFKVVCADDWIFPEFLERMVNLMEENPQVGICSSYRMDSSKVSCMGLNYYDGPVIKGKEILNQQLLNKIDVAGSESTVLYRTDILKQIERFPEIFDRNSYHFDTSLAYEIFNLSDLGFIFQVLSFTRRHEETYTSQISIRYSTSLNFREQELNKYKNIFPDLIEEYKKVRAAYGLFLLLKFIRRDKQCLEWHKNHLDIDRRFTIREYFSIVIKKILRKIFKIGKGY